MNTKKNKMKKEKRNKEIIQLIKEGKTYQEIGERFGISRQRVQQIAKKEGIKKERKKKYKCMICGKPIKAQRKYCNTCRENLKRPTFILSSFTASIMYFHQTIHHQIWLILFLYTLKT